jgi:hypothetical protein
MRAFSGSKSARWYPTHHRSRQSSLPARHLKKNESKSLLSKSLVCSAKMLASESADHLSSVDDSGLDLLHFGSQGIQILANSFCSSPLVVG